jgi:phytoene dehydrogenase-like protein
VAANLLADAGWRVTVVEASSTPGGAVRSAELAAPRYLSDVCSAFYPLAVQSPVLRLLRLDEFGLSWRHAPDVLAHMLPDDRVALLGQDPALTAESVEAFAEGDGDRWNASYEQWQAIGAQLVSAVLAPFPPVRSSLRLLRTLRASGALRLARRMVLPAQVLAEELFEGEGARLLLAGCAMHTDLAPQDAGSGIYGWLLAMLAQQHGFPVARGGAGRITDALVARLHRSGGELLCGVSVDRIEVMNGRAVSVSSADGRRWRARRAVLADVPAPVLYLDLVAAKWLRSRTPVSP